MNYCASPYRHARRDTRPVVIGDPENGGVLVGGSEAVVRQSMITGRVSRRAWRYGEAQ